MTVHIIKFRKDVVTVTSLWPQEMHDIPDLDLYQGTFTLLMDYVPRRFLTGRWRVPCTLTPVTVL
jgi:hypothetical protein